MTVLAASGICGAPGSSAERPGWVAFEGGRISATGMGGAPPESDDRAGTTELGDVVLVPGFVDLQVNGVGAVDFASATARGWCDALDSVAAHGVTGCCPTICTAPVESYWSMLDVAVAAQSDPGAGERPSLLGVHLEGPFLGGAPGAHPAALLRPADPAWVDEALRRYDDLIRIVTLAPEADPSGEVTRILVEHGVVVAIGHSDATYADAISMTDAGATLATHCFNGMGPFHHRAPGVVGAALDDERLTPSLIADLVHVHPAALRIAASSKRNVALVTDAIAVDALAVPGLGITLDGGAPRLTDGTLAGTSLTMDAAVRNMVGIGVALDRAVEMASTIPAEVLGLADRGRLSPGARADVVALDRETLTVRATWIAGHQRFPLPHLRHERR